MASPSTEEFCGQGVSRQAWPGTAAIIGGVCWSVLPLLYFYGRELHSIGVPIRYARSLLPAIAVPLLLIGVRGFSNRYGETYSSFGRGGLRGLGFGILCLWPLGLLSFLDVYVGVSIGFGGGIWVVAVAIAGALITELAAIGIGIDAWQTNTPARWMGLWFPALLPASILLNYWLVAATTILPNIGGHFYSGLFGLAWIGVGYYLWR